LWSRNLKKNPALRSWLPSRVLLLDSQIKKTYPYVMCARIKMIIRWKMYCKPLGLGINCLEIEILHLGVLTFYSTLNFHELFFWYFIPFLKFITFVLFLKFAMGLDFYWNLPENWKTTPTYSKIIQTTSFGTTKGHIYTTFERLCSWGSKYLWERMRFHNIPNPIFGFP
jgi:hypothetical protein